MARTVAALAALSAWLVAGAANAQATGDLLQRQSFETADAALTALGPTAAVSYVTDPANVKDGKTALKFTYGVKAGETNVLFSAVPAGTMTPVKSMRF